MTNCQLQLFEGGTIHPSDSSSKAEKNVPSSPTSSGDTRQLVKRIITKIRALPGNDKCCDCNSNDPEWLSVNLGVLMCIHCSGRHRELGVQYSRIRSLKLDAIKTSELLVSCVLAKRASYCVYNCNQIARVMMRLTSCRVSPDEVGEEGTFFSALDEESEGWMVPPSNNCSWQLVITWRHLSMVIQDVVMVVTGGHW